MLVDLGVGLLDSDKLLIDMLTDINKTFFLVCTKADKVNAHLVDEKLSQVTEFVRHAGSLCIPVINVVSSTSNIGKSRHGYGIHEFMANLLYHLK